MLGQLARWSLTGAFRSSDDRVDYRANLSNIRCPLLVIAGSADKIASPAMVRPAFENVRSPRKHYREFASRQGDSADYGHVDLVFGWRAPDEVFPEISSWIETEVVAG
jgi:pimeloyl-ACP methyl ester carboxylesterase